MILNSYDISVGFAYIPIVPNYLDGTVLMAHSIKPGMYVLPHELGHAFYLYHTFEGSELNFNCPNNTDRETSGDKVCDTDPVSKNINSEGEENFDCRTGINPCTSTSFNRNTERNFMGYTYCQTLLTHGQKARVRAALSLPSRASLVKSNAASYCNSYIFTQSLYDVKSEVRSPQTDGCRSYKDYAYELNIAEAPKETVEVILSFQGTATKGLDYEITTNNQFESPSNVIKFEKGKSDSQSFILRIYDDENPEPRENIEINFKLNAGSEIPIEISPFTIYVNDNDIDFTESNENIFEIGEIKYSHTNLFDSESSQQKGQFLYQASDLIAAGMKPGPIVSMQLFVASKGTAGTFKDFNLKLGTNDADFLYEKGANLGKEFVSVYSNASLSTYKEWNDFRFSTPYIWDGKSNIVVEICYNNTSGTGADALGFYNNQEMQLQFNYIFLTDISCDMPFSSYFGFYYGIKTIAKFNVQFEV